MNDFARIIRRAAAPLGLLALAACAHPGAGPVAGPATLQIIAFNDFHGHIGADDQTVLPPGAAKEAPRVKAGGAVSFAQAIARLRAENPNSAVVSAGDLIGASPLVSGQFLDEPTVRVMNSIGIDFNAVGNHEFDRGQQELRRMQTGGCAQYTLRAPCQVMPDFPGAHFPFLAANSLTANGTTLFAPYGLKQLTVHGKPVRIGFVGLTLKGTAAIISPSAAAGMRFADEAETANALVPTLRAMGADILAVLVHEGGTMKGEGDRLREHGRGLEPDPRKARSRVRSGDFRPYPPGLCLQLRLGRSDTAVPRHQCRPIWHAADANHPALRSRCAEAGGQERAEHRRRASAGE